MKIADSTIETHVYDHLYEETPNTVGKESVLMNYGLMLKNSKVDLGKLVSHFNSAKEQGLERIPTLVLRYDTKQNNALSYYIGAVAISRSMDGKPLFACFVYKSDQHREFNADAHEWVETRKCRGVYLKCTVDDEAKINVHGDGFNPIDLSDADLLRMMSDSISVLTECIVRLPTFETALTIQSYREQVLNAMVVAKVGGLAGLWNLTGWDIGLSPENIIANNITYSS